MQNNIRSLDLTLHLNNKIIINIKQENLYISEKFVFGVEREKFIMHL